MPIRTRRGLLTALGVTAIAATVAVSASAKSTAQPYKVLMIAPIATNAGDNTQAWLGMQAAAKAINKAGGLKGKVPLDVEVCNDQNGGAGGSACAQQAVDGNYDDVIQVSTATANENPILDAAQMPRIGSLLVTSADLVNPYMFTTDPPTQAFYSAPLIYLIQQQKAKRIAMLTLQIASSQTISAAQKTTVRALSGKYGSKFVGAVTVPLSQTDFAPIVQQLKNLNPDVVCTVLTQGQTIAFMSARSQLGLTAKVTGSSSTLPDPVLAQMVNGGDGLYTGTVFPPYNTPGLPGLKSFIAQMQAAGYNDPTNQYGTLAVRYWLATWALQKLSLKVNGAVTKTSMLAAAKKAKNIDLFGLTNWSPGTKGPAAYPGAPNGLGYVDRAVGGKNTLVLKTPINWYKVIGIGK